MCRWQRACRFKPSRGCHTCVRSTVFGPPTSHVLPLQGGGALRGAPGVLELGLSIKLKVLLDVKQPEINCGQKDCVNTGNKTIPLKTSEQPDVEYCDGPTEEAGEEGELSFQEQYQSQGNIYGQKPFCTRTRISHNLYPLNIYDTQTREL